MPYAVSTQNVLAVCLQGNSCSFGLMWESAMIIVLNTWMEILCSQWLPEVWRHGHDWMRRFFPQDALLGLYCRCLQLLLFFSLSLVFRKTNGMLYWIKIRWLPWQVKNIPFFVFGNSWVGFDRLSICNMKQRLIGFVSFSWIWPEHNLTLEWIWLLYQQLISLEFRVFHFKLNVVIQGANFTFYLQTRLCIYIMLSFKRTKYLNMKKVSCLCSRIAPLIFHNHRRRYKKWIIWKYSSPDSQIHPTKWNPDEIRLKWVRQNSAKLIWWPEEDLAKDIIVFLLLLAPFL